MSVGVSGIERQAVRHPLRHVHLEAVVIGVRAVRYLVDEPNIGELVKNGRASRVASQPGNAGFAQASAFCAAVRLFRQYDAPSGALLRSTKLSSLSPRLPT